MADVQVPVAPEAIVADEQPNFPLVCCAPGQTYLDEPIPAELDNAAGAAVLSRNPADFGLDVVTQLFGACRYEWRWREDSFVNPSMFTNHLALFYDKKAVKYCPASLLMRTRNVTLDASVLYCSDAAGQMAIVYETYRQNDRDVVQAATLRTIHAADRQSFENPEWRCLYVGSAGSFNYGHWLVDDLPRLKAALHMMAVDPGPIRIVIESFGAAIDRIRIESIRLMCDCPIHVDVVPYGQAYWFDTLYYVTPVTQHPIMKSPVALDFAARTAIERVSKGALEAGGTKRLFVDRHAAHGRSVVNYPEVLALLQAHGFEVIQPEGMSFVDQVQVFANASVVIGQMGAAMTNTLFCRPASMAIYLAPFGWIEPFYWDLAVARGHDYRVLYCDPIDASVPAHQGDFSVPIDILTAMIEAL